MPVPFSWVSYTITTPTVGPFGYSAFLRLEDAIVPEENQFDVFVNGIQKTLTTDYTVDTVNHEITFTSELATGDFLKIQRDTLKDLRYVDFTDGSVLTQSDLDLDSNQIFFISQEAFDLAYFTIRLGNGDWWDAQGKRVTNGLAAIDPADLVTLGQVMSLLGDGSNIKLNNPFSFAIIGDGITNIIDLTTYDPDVTNLTKPQLFMFLDTQWVDWDQYEFNANGNIVTFDSPIPAGSTLRGFWLPGTIVAKAGPLTVDSDAIVDDALIPRHFSNASVPAEAFQAGSIPTSAYGASSVDSNALALGAVFTGHIADGQVTAPKIVDGINGTSAYASKPSPLFDTAYQNTGSQLEWHTISIVQTQTNLAEFEFKIADDASFTTNVKTLAMFREGVNDGKFNFSLQGYVPADKWYKVINTGGGPHELRAWEILTISK